MRNCELEYIFERYFPALNKFARRIALNRGISEELGLDGLSAAFLELSEHQERKVFDVPKHASTEEVCKSIAPAIEKLIYFRFVDEYRKQMGEGNNRRFTQSLNQPLRDDDEEGASLASTIADQTLSSQSPIELRVGNETIEELNQAIQRLSEDQQVAIRLCYQDGLRYAEIAEVIGKSPQAIKTLMVRARSKLAKMMSRTNIGTGV